MTSQYWWQKFPFSAKITLFFKLYLKSNYCITGVVWAFTLTMLVLLSPNAQGGQNLWKSSKPCHVQLVFIWKLLRSSIIYVLMCQGFSHFPTFCSHILLTKLDISSKMVNRWVIPKKFATFFFLISKVENMAKHSTLFPWRRPQFWLSCSISLILVQVINFLNYTIIDVLSPYIGKSKPNLGSDH